MHAGHAGRVWLRHPDDLYFSGGAYQLHIGHFILAGATAVQTPLATFQDEKDEMGTRPCGDVGALAWIALGTRRDIAFAFATSTLVRYGRNPGGVHWEAVKRVLRYLKGTKG